MTMPDDGLYLAVITGDVYILFMGLHLNWGMAVLEMPHWGILFKIRCLLVQIITYYSTLKGTISDNI